MCLRETGDRQVAATQVSVSDFRVKYKMTGFSIIDVNSIANNAAIKKEKQYTVMLAKGWLRQASRRDALACKAGHPERKSIACPLLYRIRCGGIIDGVYYVQSEKTLRLE